MQEKPEKFSQKVEFELIFSTSVQIYHCFFLKDVKVLVNFFGKMLKKFPYLLQNVKSVLNFSQVCKTISDIFWQNACFLFFLVFSNNMQHSNFFG